MTRRRLLDVLFASIGRLLVGICVFFMLAPIALVIALSFSADAFLKVPPSTWGFTSYLKMVNDGPWVSAAGQSMMVGVLAAGLAVLVAVPALATIYRSQLPGRKLLQPLALGALVIPSTAYAVALYGFFVQAGLMGTLPGIILSHAVLGIPLVLIVAGNALQNIPIELELVAMSLGAGRSRAWMTITLRLLVPGVIAGFVLAFIQSFDEVVFIVFLGGAHIRTLPKAIFDSLRFGVDPVPTAISTVLIIVFAGLLVLVNLLRRRRT